MDAAKELELNGFLAVLKGSPGDATAVAVAADFIEENGLMPWREGKEDDFSTMAEATGRLRTVAERLPRAWAEWEKFAKRLKEIERLMLNYNTVVDVKSNDRSISQKRQAELTRELFKELNLPGISVTCATGSMCFWVNVALPGRFDHEYLRYLDKDFKHGEDAGSKQRAWALMLIIEILDRAFPNHDDRSDSMTDYFDDPWSIKFKTLSDYAPKPLKKPPGPKVQKLPDLDEKIAAFVTAWHENGRIGWSYDALEYDSYCKKHVKERTKYIALDEGTSGRFLVDKATGMMWSIKAYGVPNWMLGTLDDMTRKMEEATAESLMAMNT